MVSRVFIFIFFYLEPTVRKRLREQYDIRTTRVTVMVFFRIFHPESYLITAIFEVSSQQL